MEHSLDPILRPRTLLTQRVENLPKPNTRRGIVLPNRRTKCLVCGTIIEHPLFTETKYCSKECRKNRRLAVPLEQPAPQKVSTNEEKRRE